MHLASLLLRTGSAVVLFAALAGCVTTTVALDPLKLPAGAVQSPVVVSITTNTGQVSGFSQINVNLIPPKGSERGIAQHYVLERKVPEMARDTSLFIGTLPPGKYEFVSLSDVRTNQILRLDNGTLLGSFEVEAGKPVDLGRLIVTPLNSRMLFGRSQRVVSNAELLARVMPAHAGLFASGSVTGWGRPRVEKDKVEEYASERPVGADCATELEDGRVVAASRLGIVLLRDAQGRWGSLRGPGIDSLLCVAPADLPDAELLAVGEFGTLLRKPPQENKLVPVATGNMPTGNILGIAGNRKAGWTVGVQSGTSVIVLHTPELYSGSWTPVETLDIGMDFWNGASKFWMWGHAQHMGYTVTAGPIHDFDYASGKWTVLDTPNKARLIELVVEPSGAVGALTSPGGGFGGVFASGYVSKDRGRGWQPVEVPVKVKSMPVRHDYAGNMYMASGPMGKPELHVSKDSGKTWSLISDRNFSRKLLPLRSGGLLDFGGAEYGIFSIEHSADGGRNWKLEYTNFDREAYKLSRK